MSNYYYLGAQLPYIIYGQPVPVSSWDFREMAMREMDRSDARDLEFCTLEPIPQEKLTEAKVSSNLIKAWHNWEEVLRLNLAKNRSMKLNRYDVVFENVPEAPHDAVAAAKNAFNADSPLEGEFILDKARWNAIEDFLGAEYFSANVVYAFLLKLQLMERKLTFDADEGFAEYKNIYASILTKTGDPA
ncbi:MAG: DUF2764 domain-containing protein [Treponema sp.]|jgi:hypothetical protein|nr:DUF2764 domain-containing protein [Treponema sp.]